MQRSGLVTAEMSISASIQRSWGRLLKKVWFVPVKMQLAIQRSHHYGRIWLVTDACGNPCKVD